ncbi:MAG: tRNA (N6-threonylcarbamoyladenosine(37)-N6)-methyltransferase TrmO [Pseudomonadota bacterium]|jgi:tRNA-Thr(GGU) m(6)t(6)A37 methyltransferase TsaA
MSELHNVPPFSLSPIGTISSDYPDKFGVPRQPGLVTAASATLTLTPPFDDPLCVRGLEEFSHIWVSFIFHQNPERWAPMVRPPRLGGNKKVGVFASRSPNRPNRLGLSLVALERIDTRKGVRLHLKGADLVDGTPVIDIKPYLPWADNDLNARAGFAPASPDLLEVTFSAAAESALNARDDGQELRELIYQVLSQDPRPAYHANDSGRIYGLPLRNLDVRFLLESATTGRPCMQVISLEPRR